MGNNVLLHEVCNFQNKKSISFCISICMFIDCCKKLQNHTFYKIYENKWYKRNKFFDKSGIIIEIIKVLHTEYLVQDILVRFVSIRLHSSWGPVPTG